MFDIHGTPPVGWRIHNTPMRIELQTLTLEEREDVEEKEGLRFQYEQICDYPHILYTMEGQGTNGDVREE